MALTVGEKIGAFVGFIPLVSTVSGIIKAIIYHKRTKHDPVNVENMNQTAIEVAEISKKKLSDLEDTYNNKLWKSSICEMIPIVNVIAASYSAFILNELSDARENSQYSKKTIKSLFRKYGLEEFKEEQKNKRMFDMIVLLEETDPMKKSILSHWRGGMIRLDSNNLPPAEILIERARDALRTDPPTQQQFQTREQVIKEMEKRARENLKGPPPDFD